MRVEFKTLKAQGFKSHELLEIEFFNFTKISGRNGAGKSSIGEMISWALFDCDTMGSKFSPIPLNAEPGTLTSVELLAQITRPEQEPKLVLFTRQLVNGKAKYFINEVPEKAKKYDEIIGALFDKNLFLSLFNPVYFFSQHWKEQRQQLLNYVPEPLNAEILDKLPKIKREALEERLKRNTPEELAKIFTPKHKDANSRLERLGERYLTLKEQAEQAAARLEGQDIEGLQAELRELQNKLNAANSKNDAARQGERQRGKLDFEIESIKRKINEIKNSLLNYMEQPLADSCSTCGQALAGEALEKVKQHREEHINQGKLKGKALMGDFKRLTAELEQLGQGDGSEPISTGELQGRIYEISSVLDAAALVENLKAQAEQAAAQKEQARQEMLEALAIIEAVKDFETAKAELMVNKVGALFNRLTVKLFEEFQNGNSKPTFEAEYEGRPYSKLSTAERIKAGLELIEAIASQSGIISPVFIDNAESIITFKKPSGQLITATVKNSHLVIKNGEEKE